MKLLDVVYHPEYSFEFPEGHRFAMSKFRLLYEYLLETGAINSCKVWRPGEAPLEWLSKVHCQHYVQAIKTKTLTEKEARRMGLPLSDGLVRRTFLSPMGTLMTAHLALDQGIACHLAGGTHHAHYDYGSGFCIFNDIAFALIRLLNQGLIKRGMVFDCDVHQGDGTAAILAGYPTLYTCSIQGERNFPVRRDHSDLDIDLPDGTADTDYLEAVKKAFEKAVETSKPDLIIYDAGVDPYTGDSLGRLDITERGIRARDEWVLSRCAELQIPVATVIGGGYDDDRHALARRHAIVIESALNVRQLTTDSP